MTEGVRDYISNRLPFEGYIKRYILKLQVKEIVNEKQMIIFLIWLWLQMEVGAYGLKSVH